MNAATIQLDAGGLLSAKTKVDAEAAEQIVARTYRHAALGDRPVIRLASDRLGQAEDLAMEFLGFEAPTVSAPIAIQQRRSLSFAAWALIHDPKNARYALDLVKRMKGAARQAKSKPGHAWDAYTEMAKELGRSARHFLPPFWEEVGRTFKDLGNQTYAGRALNKSLEAERVHALESDRARRRDVVLEFVLSGCLAGNALSDYGNDLQNQYAPAEAFSIFRDLCLRRTRGGMSPWAGMPKDFARLAKAAGLDSDQELERWLEEAIESPAMGRAPLQFWKTCGSHCKRIVARNPAFAIALLRHTRPESRYYGESKLGPWFELLEEWGVLEFLWTDQYQGAPALGEPMAHWFGRIVRDDIPAPKRTLEMLEKLAPRLRSEDTPLPLSVGHRYGANAIDIDVLEACFVQGIKVDDPPTGFTVTFNGWLTANVDHPCRNQDLVASPRDGRFQAAISHGLTEALTCRGGALQRGYRQASLEQRPFPLAAGDRPGIKELWRQHTSDAIGRLEGTGLASFEAARAGLETTLWPDTLRLFPELAERLNRIDPVAMLRRTLQAGVFDEYGLPALEQAVDQGNIKIQFGHFGETNIHLTFPNIVVADKVHAHVVGSDGKIKKHEMRLPKKSEITSLVAVGTDLAVAYRDDKYQGHFYWVSDPAQHYDSASYYYGGASTRMATVLKDGSVFLGQQAVRPGDKQMPSSQNYLHDGERFWRLTNDYDQELGQSRAKIHEVDPQTGKQLRESVPAWFEETDGGTIELFASELMPAPAGADDSPLGTKDGMIGWKTVKRRDGTYYGAGIDGRRWDAALNLGGGPGLPVGLLRQPGTERFLPVVTAGGRMGTYCLCDPTGTTIVANLHDFTPDFAHGQVTVLPLCFWHLLKVRDEASSRKLRAISEGECAALLKAAAEDRAQQKGKLRGPSVHATENRLVNLLPAVKALLPGAPERMVVGIARVIERAESESAAFTALRDKASADSKKQPDSSSLIVNTRSDNAAAHWGMTAFHIYGDEGNASVSGHLAAAAEFLKGHVKPGDLPRTNYLWFSMLEDLPLRAWQTFWRATAAKMAQKDGSDVPWLEFLKLWHELGIAELPGQFDLMEGLPEGVKRKQWGGYDFATNGGTSFTIQNGDDRFIVIENQAYSDSLPYHFLRYSTAKEPGTPPGYDVKNVRKIKAKYDPAQIAAFIAAVESCTALPIPSKDELAEVARTLSTSPAEIGLIWMGGLNLDSYQANFLPAGLRTAFGWKTTEASAARQALRNLNPALLGHLYDAVVAVGCAAPFAADRGPVLRAMEKTWHAKMPRRLQLDAALQKRLSALGSSSRWHHVNHEEILAVAADPVGHPMLQPRQVEIQVEKNQYGAGLRLGVQGKHQKADEDEAVGLGDFARSIVHLVALVYAETPAGNAARAAMPALVKQMTRLLDHSSTLLDLRSVHLYDFGKKKPPTPTEWLNQHLGKTKANAKDATARFDDGLIAAAALDAQHQALIAFRPAKLKSDGELVRLQAILGIDVADEDKVRTGCLPIIVVIKSSGFQKLATAIHAKEAPAGQWAQNPQHTAPEVVKGIRKKLKLGEEAAMLYAQLLAVPDPTTANVCSWNGWTAAQFKKASAELVARKLVLEATRARAGRSIFLPGEWSDLKAPWLPIETWKLAHLVELNMNPREPCPAGGPLVLRPFDELFAAAWRRVVQGDEPRYEDVKRKKKAR
ncbi:MAG: hypothetical protein HYX68_23285 [Planctomycetes bacterium]|nr:hypothetical protein [Planctomycetota bacterium]